HAVFDQLDRDLGGTPIAQDHIIAHMRAVRAPAIALQDRAQTRPQSDSLPGSVALLLGVVSVLLDLDQNAVFINQKTRVQAVLRIMIPPGRLLLQLYALFGRIVSARVGARKTSPRTLFTGRTRKASLPATAGVTARISAAAGCAGITPWISAAALR